jgi:hypothetical protein
VETSIAPCDHDDTPEELEFMLAMPEYEHTI